MTGLPAARHALDWVLWNSAGAGVLVVLVFAAIWLFGSRISARWRHNLWMLVVLRLLAPMLPAVHLPAALWANIDKVHYSWSNRSGNPPNPNFTLTGPRALEPREFTDQTASRMWETKKPSPELNRENLAETSTSPRLRLAWAGAPPAEPSPPQGAAISPDSIPQPSRISRIQPLSIPSKSAVRARSNWRAMTWPAIMTMVWLVVASFLLARIIWITARLSAATLRLERLRDPAVEDLLRRCCRELQVNTAPTLLIGPAGSGPALVGAIFPRLLLPRGVVDEFPRCELRLILLHELAHHRRRDIAINYVLSFLQSLHWFNPLIWFAFNRLREERELACDEMVLSITAGRESRTYGSTIVRLLEMLSRGAAPSGAVGAIQHKALMHRRIAMIAHFEATRRIGWKGLLPMLAISLVGAASLVRAQPPADAPAPPAPNVALEPKNSKEAPTDAVAKARAKIEGAAEPATDARSPMDESPPPPESPAPGLPPRTTVPQEKRAPNTAIAIRGIEDPASIRADEQTLEKLRHPQSLELNGVPLPDVLAQLADATKLDIVIDNRAISQETGIDPANNPVTMRIREPRPAGDLLQLALRLVNPDLDYAIVNGVVLVSTRGELARHLVTRVYRVDGLGNVTELSNAVAQVIRPESGRPELQFVGSKLIVTAPEPAQRQVRKLLDLLADQPAEKVDAANAPKTLQSSPPTPQRLAIIEQLRQLGMNYRVVIKRNGGDSQQARDLRVELQALSTEAENQAEQLGRAGRESEAEQVRQSVRAAVSDTLDKLEQLRRQ